MVVSDPGSVLPVSLTAWQHSLLAGEQPDLMNTTYMYCAESCWFCKVPNFIGVSYAWYETNVRAIIKLRIVSGTQDSMGFRQPDSGKSSYARP